MATTRRRRIACVLLGFVGLIALAAVVNSCVARQALEREIAEMDRDPETGVIRGCEALTLTGTGERACLLVHGFLGSRDEFGGLAEALRAKGLTVRLMRLPGHGTTPEELERTTADEFRSAVRSEFRLLRERHRHVDAIGFSLGGALATLLAAEEDVHRLVLVAPYYGVTYRWFYVLTPEAWTRLLRPIVPYVVKARHPIHLNREGVKEKIFSYGVVPLQAALTLYELGEAASDAATLGRIRAPVLLVQSRGDHSADPDAAERAFELIGSEAKAAKWYERSNHHLLQDHDGEEAIGEIVQFLLSE